MQKLKQLAIKFDNYQQRHSVIGFPLAVFKKFGDDEAGNQAALITYYGFLSLFPLLLVLVTVLELIVTRNPELQEKIISTTLEFFPVMGELLQKNLRTIDGHGLGLAIGVLATFVGARGVANAIQSALNQIWQVQRTQRPGFPWSMLRSLSLIVAGGGGLILTTTLAGYITSFDNVGMLAKAFALAIVFVPNFGLLLLGFRLGIARKIKTRELVLPAAVAAIFWQILQAIGSYLLLHQLKNFDAVYGIFAVVLGLLFWIYLQAQVTLYAVEIGVVKAQKLWPRSFIHPVLTKSDKKAYAGYPQAEKRRQEEKIKVSFKDKPK